MSPKHDLTVISFFFSFHIVIILATIMIRYTILFYFFMLEQGYIENNMKHMCDVKGP